MGKHCLGTIHKPATSPGNTIIFQFLFYQIVCKTIVDLVESLAEILLRDASPNNLCDGVVGRVKV